MRKPWLSPALIGVWVSEERVYECGDMRVGLCVYVLG